MAGEGRRSPFRDGDFLLPWRFSRHSGVTESSPRSCLPSGGLLSLPRPSPSFLRHMGLGESGEMGPLVNSMGFFHKEAQVLFLKTCGDKKRSLTFFWGRGQTVGENQRGLVQSDHQCLGPPSDLLL